MEFTDERDRFMNEYKMLTEVFRPMNPLTNYNAQWLRGEVGLLTGLNSMTATEVRMRAAEESARMQEAIKKKIAEVMAMEDIAAKSKKQPPKPPEPKVTPIIDRAIEVHTMLCSRGLGSKSVSIVLPEEDWVILAEELEIFYNWKVDRGGSVQHFCGMEFLRGTHEYSVWFSGSFTPNEEALSAEIIRCLSGGRVSELPERTGSDRVSASPDSSGKVGVASSPAIGNNRNGNSVRHIPDQLDVVSAQAAIAAYARDKKLPGSVSLAQLRELDDRLAQNKRTAAISGDSAKARKLWARTARFNNVEGDGHGLSSEPLSRAINQLNVAEDGRAHRDFIGAAAQGFAEMLDAGDASAHRKR